MILGVSQKEQNIISAILADYRAEYQFFAYGSRVKGGYSKVSDLDILIKGKSAMPYEQLETLKHKFDCSLIPYVVNFSDYHKIDTVFYQQIREDLQLL